MDAHPRDPGLDVVPADVDAGTAADAGQADVRTAARNCDSLDNGDAIDCYCGVLDAHANDASNPRRHRASET